MGIQEILIASLTTLCLNSTCIDNYYSTNNLQKIRKYEELKKEIRSETFVVTTLKNGPLSGYEEINNTIKGTGVAFDIFHVLQKEYNFKYIIKVPEQNVFVDETTETVGVKDLLLAKEADIAVAFLPEQYEEKVIKYSRSLDRASWMVLMKRPTESATGSGLLAPFNSAVWTLIILSVLAVGPILWLIIYLRARMCKDDDYVEFSLPSCMWFVYGALLKQGSTLSPQTDSSRIFFATWWIFITILTAFYTANLTAFLTLSKFTLPISEPKDINKKHYKWVTNKGNGIIEQVYKDPKFNEYDNSLYLAIGLPHAQIDDEETILENYVEKNKFMYIREKTVLESIMYEDYKSKTKANKSETDKCAYVITKFPVWEFPRSFAFRPGFKYKPLFDATIQHLSESGITRFKQREFLPDTTICPLDLGNIERKLRNSDLSMTYMIVGGGLIISTIIFTIELIMHYAKLYNSINCCSKHRQGIISPNNNRRNLENGLFTITNNSLLQRDRNPFVTPPPPYHSLFEKPPLLPSGSVCKRKIVNGREYWVVNNNNNNNNSNNGISLIPYRAPSALLFQFTN